MTKVLMCPPDYFDIEYSINPWMDIHHKASGDKSQQWKDLTEVYKGLGMKIELMHPQPDQPDMVYVDVGVKLGNVFIPSNFAFPERQGERPHIIDWFRGAGYEIRELSPDLKFEGHGDSLWSGNRLFCGYGFRTDREAHNEIGKYLNEVSKVELISIGLTDDRFYHLDTCFCPITEDLAICYPAAIESESLAKIKEEFDTVIEVSDEDALKFACNSFVLGNDIVMPAGAEDITEELEQRGYTVHQVEMSEFIKGGGACKCLTMPLS